MHQKGEGQVTLSEETGAGKRRSRSERKRLLSGWWIAASLLIILFVLSGCEKEKTATVTPTPDRSSQVLRIALSYESGGDVEKARRELENLGVTDPAGFVADLAVEYEKREGASSKKTMALARLAFDLGYRGEDVAVLAGRVASPSPTESLATPTPVSVPTATDTPVPSPSPTPTPAKPVVIAHDWTNVRLGPGKVYPRIGHLRPEEIAFITGLGPNGKWWRIKTKNGREGWVFDGVVDVRGPIGSVKKIVNVPPTPRPTFTPTPAATSTPSVDFVVVKQRLWTVEENGGSVDHGSVRCGYKHQIYVTVVDKNGQPIDGIVVERIYAKTRGVSGTKGPGRLVFSLFSHGDKLRVVGDVNGRSFTSQVTRNLDVRDDQIPIKDLIAAHYCTDPVSCQQLIDANHLCRGHYSWSVVFQRQW